MKYQEYYVKSTLKHKGVYNTPFTQYLKMSEINKIKFKQLLKIFLIQTYLFWNANMKYNVRFSCSNPPPPATL